MAGDIRIRERAVILPETRALEAAASVGTDATARGSYVWIARAGDGRLGRRPRARGDGRFDGGIRSGAELAVARGTARLCRLYFAGIGRVSVGKSRPSARRRELGFQPGDAALLHAPDERAGHAAEAMAMAEAPTSQRLTGSVAVGIIIVEGPNANLTFSAAERTKVVAEVQNGLGWLATQNPEGLVFKYDIKIVTLNVQPGPGTLTFDQKETRWRDPAMQQLGFATGMAGVSAYVEQIRTNLGTTWTYCAFFTKYPLGHFAYASIGGPRLVMHYDNDGWGPDNIDRVFAHESGHIFGAPDEYASSGCNCGGSWGFYGKPNANCANCAPSGGVDCLMKGNTWSMCVHTPYHLGLPLVQQTYTGVWRQGNDAHYLWVNASWTTFVAKWQQLAQQNLRLVDMKITRENGVERFHGVWRQGTGGHYLWVNATKQTSSPSGSNWRRRACGWWTSKCRTSTARCCIPASGCRAPMATTCGSTPTGTTSWPNGSSWRSRTCDWST